MSSEEEKAAALEEFKNAHPIAATGLTVCAFVVVAFLVITAMAAVGLACVAFLGWLAETL